MSGRSRDSSDSDESSRNESVPDGYDDSEPRGDVPPVSEQSRRMRWSEERATKRAEKRADYILKKRAIRSTFRTKPIDSETIKNPHAARKLSHKEMYPELTAGDQLREIPPNTPPQLWRKYKRQARKERRAKRKELRAESRPHQMVMNGLFSTGGWMLNEFLWFYAMCLEAYIWARFTKNFFLGLTGKYAVQRRKQRHAHQVLVDRNELENLFDDTYTQRAYKLDNDMTGRKFADRNKVYIEKEVHQRLLDERDLLVRRIRMEIDKEQYQANPRQYMRLLRGIPDAVEQQMQTVMREHAENNPQLDAQDTEVAKSCLRYLVESAAHIHKIGMSQKRKIVSDALEKLGPQLFSQISGVSVSQAQLELGKNPDVGDTRNVDGENSFLLRNTSTSIQDLRLAMLRIVTQRVEVDKSGTTHFITSANPVAAVALGAMHAVVPDTRTFAQDQDQTAEQNAAEAAHPTADQTQDHHTASQTDGNPYTRENAPHLDHIANQQPWDTPQTQPQTEPAPPQQTPPTTQPQPSANSILQPTSIWETSRPPTAILPPESLSWQRAGDELARSEPLVTLQVPNAELVDGQVRTESLTLNDIANLSQLPGYDKGATAWGRVGAAILGMAGTNVPPPPSTGRTPGQSSNRNPGSPRRRSTGRNRDDDVSR